MRELNYTFGAATGAPDNVLDDGEGQPDEPEAVKPPMAEVPGVKSELEQITAKQVTSVTPDIEPSNPGPSPAINMNSVFSAKLKLLNWKKQLDTRKAARRNERNTARSGQEKARLPTVAGYILRWWVSSTGLVRIKWLPSGTATRAIGLHQWMEQSNHHHQRSHVSNVNRQLEDLEPTAPLPE